MTTLAQTTEPTEAHDSVASSADTVEATARKYCLRILQRIGEKHRRLEKRGVADASESGRLACEAREVCRRYRLSFADDYIDATGLSKSKVFADIRLFQLTEEYPQLLTCLATVRAGYLLSAKSTPEAVIDAVVAIAKEQQRTVSEADVQELIARHRPVGSTPQRAPKTQVSVAGATVVIRPGKDTSPQVVEALVEAIRRIAAKAVRLTEARAERAERPAAEPAP